MKILYIEDEEEACKRVKQALDHVGLVYCDFRCVKTLHEGSNAIVTFQPSIILLDLNLEDSRGLQTVDRISTFDLHAPVVVLSGQSEDMYEKPCMDAGAMNFIYKPTFLAPGLEAFFVKALNTSMVVWKRINTLRNASR